MDPSTDMSPPPSLRSSILLPPLLLAGGILAGVAVLLLGFQFLLKKYRHRETDASTAPVKLSGDDVKKVLSSIPVLCYTKNELSLTQTNCSECSVCLSGIEEGEKVRILPGCGHGFHARCIDAWLRTRLSCPVCRSAVTVSPECVGRPLDAGKCEDDCSLPV